MFYPIQGRMGRHVRQLAASPSLGFSQILTDSMIRQALQDCGLCFRQRLYTPMVTLWALLWQTLSSQHTCGEAVARVLAWRLSQGLAACSANTGSYCQARQRLDVKLLIALVHQLGQRLHTQTPADWRWKGRCVKVVDGSTVSMPDTPANQRRFAQPRTQKPGLGFPIARLVVIFSLHCGAALQMAVGPYKGKTTGENSLFRRLLASLAPGDVVLGDRAFSGYCDLALLQQRGADVLVRQHQLRKTDLRRARRLGRGDHLVTWHKPSQCPQGIDPQMFAQLPNQLPLRQVTIHVAQPGRRTRKLTLVTTLLESSTYSPADLAALYRQRWEAELNLRSLKCMLQMDVLRCLTPAMVEKELWAHLLAYNAVRMMMAQAAERHGRCPTRLSFSSALQLLRAFHAHGLLHNPLSQAALLQAIAQCTVPDRPDRIEPRAVKRRPKPHKQLQQPRHKARKATL